MIDSEHEDEHEPVEPIDFTARRQEKAQSEQDALAKQYLETFQPDPDSPDFGKLDAFSERRFQIETRNRQHEVLERIRETIEAGVAPCAREQLLPLMLELYAPLVVAQPYGSPVEVGVEPDPTISAQSEELLAGVACSGPPCDGCPNEWRP